MAAVVVVMTPFFAAIIIAIWVARLMAQAARWWLGRLA
jgi:hypothetical protein